MIHALKTTPKYFEDVISGKKPFEVRRNDRDFREGDFAALNEYDPDSRAAERDRYTGRSALFRICYVLDNPEYCKAGYVVLGLETCSVVPSGESGREAIAFLLGRVTEVRV